MTRILLAGVSTRAAAASAARAGFVVTAVDAFADLDQHPSVRALSVTRQAGVPFSAMAAARVCRRIVSDAVAFLSSVDNSPRAVAALGRGRTLWGNPVDVLRRVRDPFDVAGVLSRRGFPVPAVGHTATHDARRWLIKPRRSGGGHHVREYSPGAALPAGAYLQERIDGIPASIVFAAAGGRAVPLGVSHQLIGDPEFGGSGFRYCGSILANPDVLFESGAALIERARAIVDVVTREYGLIGVNGIDFIARDDLPFPIEVNPRWCSSMELVERAHERSVFAIHARACDQSVLPGDDLVGAVPRDAVTGKAIVYARSSVMIGDTRGWLGDSDIRDVPHPGERIPRGAPICTVFAGASDVAACRAALTMRAREIYACLERWRQEAA